MEKQTSTPTPKLRLPARSDDICLALRIVILTLDLANMIALAVSVGLYHKWIPNTSYPKTALQPDTHTDWTDLVVFAAVLVSFVWTIFITIRPGWTHRSLHLGYHIGFEFVCLAWLLASSIPAFLLRESDFTNLAPVSDTCDMDTATLMNGLCVPHLDTLKKLQVATYSIACAVAVIHFTFFALACYSMLQRPRSPANFAIPQHAEKDADRQEAFPDETTQTSTTTTRRSESDSSPVPPLRPPPPPSIQVTEF